MDRIAVKPGVHFRGVAIMDVKNYNTLTAAETERLALLAEECGECIQAVCKILRHGYSNYDQTCTKTYQINRTSLECKISDIRVAVCLLTSSNDLSEQRIREHKDVKVKKIRHYLHHQELTYG